MNNYRIYVYKFKFGKTNYFYVGATTREIKHRASISGYCSAMAKFIRTHNLHGADLRNACTILEESAPKSREYYWHESISRELTPRGWVDLNTATCVMNDTPEQVHAHQNLIKRINNHRPEVRQKDRERNTHPDRKAYLAALRKAKAEFARAVYGMCRSKAEGLGLEFANHPEWPAYKEKYLTNVK